MIELMSIYGNPNIGVYVFANNRIAIIPPGIPEKDRKKIEDTLDVEVIEAKIADMVINGVLIAGNDKGILLPRIVRPEELDKLKETIGSMIRIQVLETRPTALGNLIVANSRSALISPLIEKNLLPVIKEILGVEEIMQKDLAGIPTIGSMLVVTNSGGVVHPGINDEELEFLRQFFDVGIDTATVNFGVYFVRAGIIANDKGVLVGDETTGPELMRIQQALRISS